MSSFSGLEEQIQRAMLKGMGLSDADVELGLRRQAARERGERVGTPPEMARVVGGQRGGKRAAMEELRRRARGEGYTVWEGDSPPVRMVGGGESCPLDGDEAERAIEGELV